METVFLPIAFACFNFGGCMFYSPYPPTKTFEECKTEVVKLRQEVKNSKGGLNSFSLNCQVITLSNTGTKK